MRINRFQTGLLHRRYCCPGLLCQRHKRSCRRGEKIKKPTFKDAQPPQNVFSWLINLCIAGLIQAILSVAIAVALFSSSIANSISYVSISIAKSMFHSIANAVIMHRHPYYGPAHSRGITAPIWRIFIVLCIGIMPLFAIAPYLASPTVIRERNAKGFMAILIMRDLEHSKDVEDIILRECITSYVKRKKLSKIRRMQVRKRMFRQRMSWKSFHNKLTDRQFRRYFRMSRECFHLLCDKIKKNIGEREFKSEAYLERFRHAAAGNKLNTTNILRAHEMSTGGFIAGEIKLAMTLRLLAGGSYMDLALLFTTGWSYSYKIFHDVIKDWILDDRLVQINGIDYCCDENRMAQVALEFSRSSNGVINGCIGALDGWIVKIQRPSKKDNVRNPSSFYSRKGFFGVNVQAIVDKKKRILFRSILSRGAEHDSTAIKNDPLHEWLLSNWESLAKKGFYFIGDSAYSLKSFLLTPYDNVMHGTTEDNFNFFHSSSRIVVECAFGEIDMRWGVLWRPLKFTLKHNCQVIDACMRLHNFIVDFREADKNNDDGAAMERDVFDDDCRRFLAVSPEIDEGGVHGGEQDICRDANGNRLVGGRPYKADTSSSAYGRSWRDAIRDEIARQNLVRPNANWYRINNRIFND